jgi:hypothetical protein
VCEGPVLIRCIRSGIGEPGLLQAHGRPECWVAVYKWMVRAQPQTTTTFAGQRMAKNIALVTDDGWLLVRAP